MPKYIRTKDKIYEVIEENSNYYKCIYDNGRITLVAKFDNDVNGFPKALKQAHTIEELCDEFVQIISNGKIIQRSISRDLHQLKIKKEMYEIYNKVDTFGAIWTDKGLIYVAKMNENGELELLWKN